MCRRIRCQARTLLWIGCLLVSPVLGAAPPTADAIEVALEGTIAADGRLKGTLTARWKGRPAADLRARLEGLEGAARDAKLLAMIPAALAGKVGGFSDDPAGIRIDYSVEAPRFAAAGHGSLAVPLALYAPYDSKGIPVATLPLSIVHDVRLSLPSGMVPASLPSAFSTVTPTGGRYLLYFDVEGPPPGKLIARRELALDAASLSEILETAGARDTGVTLVPARPGAAARP